MSQDLRVNLCGLQQDNVVMVKVRIIMWESLGDSHAVATVGNKTVRMFESFGLCIKYIF